MGAALRKPQGREQSPPPGGVASDTAQGGRVHMTTDDNQRMLWVVHMHRIRHEQDQQAFAELFSPLAPRVKGF